jgi:signal transduction histidine kinase
MSFAAPRILPRSVFSDDEETRRKALLAVLASVFTALTIAFAVFASLIQPDIFIRAANSALVTLALGMASVALSWRGFGKTACWLFVAGNIAAITQRVATGGGIHAPSLSLYFVFALIAGTLLGRRASIATASATILICLGVALGQRAGLLPTPAMSLSYLTDWWLNALSMLAIIFVVYLQAVLMGHARTRLEEELAQHRRTDSHLQVALRAGAVGIWDGEIGSGRAWTDERTAQLFGVARAEDGTVPFADWLATIHPDDLAKVNDALQAVALRGARGRMQYRVVRADGEIRHVEGTGAAVTDPDGKVVSHVGTVTDITERKRREAEKERHEQERRALEEQLQQAQKREVMGTLAGGIAHDFNNLLTAIQNFAALIEEDETADREVRQFAERILGACGRGKDIVAQILTFARTGVQRQEMLDLATFLSESEPLLLPVIAKGATLSLPESERPLWVRGNPGQLLQLIANLCINAAEAMGTGGGEIAVTLIAASRTQVARLVEAPPAPSVHRVGQADPSRAYALLCVKDDGQGMTPEVLKRVFDPFFTTKGRQYGSGLGLSVCQGIVESHDGFCMVESAPGKGTRFSVLLPLAAREQAEAPRHAEADGKIGGGERILVVDDDRDVLDSMVLGLKRYGYQVQGFDDPLTALKAVERNPDAFDLVIADRIMPGLYGVELLERIRALGPHIRTALCSGHADPDNDQSLPGVELRLAKPIAPAELALAVRGLLAVRSRPVRPVRA